ncbi:MAG: pilin [bacterium]|nr:pilin [bacterium]
MNFINSIFLTNIAYADGVDDFIQSVNGKILNPVITLLFAVAVVVFLWGVSQMILNADNDEAKTVGKSHILWGVIGMTIMFSVWGILNLVLRTIGVTGIDPQKGKVQLNDYNPPVPGIGDPGDSFSDTPFNPSSPFDSPEITDPGQDNYSSTS